MKVFISWSGDISHKVAIVFRDWIPSVIQSIEPYVSSEDIDKGARWSTDIAKELENSNFGILCVTRENLEAPWLSFEAGALSKTMDKSYVSPFLFDIKRSEVNGPILQFQSTIFQKEDIEKLVSTINKACGEVKIPDARLKKAFEVWYPTLEEELNKIKVEPIEEKKQVEAKEPSSSEILEEILDLSRNNQKLLRNPDSKIYESLEEMKKGLDSLVNQNDRRYDMMAKRINRLPPMFFEEILISNKGVGSNYYPALIFLSQFKDDFPWIYDAGRELVTLLKSPNAMINEKHTAITEFRDMVEFTFSHPTMRERYIGRKDSRMFLEEMTYVFEKSLAK